jgi:hypothetical protein
VEKRRNSADLSGIRFRGWGMLARRVPCEDSTIFVFFLLIISPFLRRRVNSEFSLTDVFNLWIRLLSPKKKTSLITIVFV